MMKAKFFVLILAAASWAGMVTGQSFTEMMQNPEAYNFFDIKAAANAYFEAEGTGKGSGYKQYMRWAEMMEPRVYPSGKIENVTQKSIEGYKEYVNSEYFRNLPAEKSNTGNWTSIGPANWNNSTGSGPGNGRINVVAFHPTNTSILYAGAPAGGLWRSTNSGGNWTPLTDGMPRIGVSGIAIHPTNANIIYILTGDGDGADTPGIGVLRTTDGGGTWVSRSNGLSINTTSVGFGGQTNHPAYSVRGFKLLINNSDPNILLAATAQGLFRTTNAGESWTAVLTGFVTDIAFKPGDFNTVYAVRNEGCSPICGSFYRSTNGGASFSVVAGGLPTNDFTRIAIGVTPANANYVYLLFGGGSTGFRGLFRSTNSGGSFTQRSTSPNIMGRSNDGSDTAHQAGYDIAIAVSPTNAELVVTGGIEVWKSTNGGSTWSKKSATFFPTALFDSYIHADIHFAGYRGSTLWFGTDGGVFRSTDNADSFESRSNGLSITQYYKICIESNSYIGGTQDNGTNQLFNNNTTAQHILGGDGFSCLMNPSDPGKIYATTQVGPYFKSILFGFFLPMFPPGIGTDNASTHPWNVAWVWRPGSNNTFFYGGFGNVWRSTNEGGDWTNIGGSFGSSSRIYSMAMGASNSTRLYAATRTTIKRTDNATAAVPSFTTITTGLPSPAITGIAVDPTNSNRVFVSFSGYNASNKVFQSLDAGATWTNITGTLPNVGVHCIVHDGNPGGLYIGTDVGVFYRSNAIGGWIPFANGLPNTMVAALEIRSAESRIYAGTYGRGMWRSNLFTACPTTHTLTNNNDPSNPNYTGFQYYEASNTVTSTRLVNGGPGTDVTYQGGNNVTLLPGFEAQVHSEFRARIGSCNTVFQPNQQPMDGVLVFENVSDEFPIESSILETPMSYDLHHRTATRVFPNPMSNYLNLEVAAFDAERKFNVQLFDITGQLVHSFGGYACPAGLRMSLQFETGNLTPGVYMIRVIEADNAQAFKVVKQ